MNLGYQEGPKIGPVLTTMHELAKERKPADDIQHGGSHYKDMSVQPWHVMEAVLTKAEFIGYLKGNIIKYGMRQGKKDSPDAEKCRHYQQKLREFLATDY